jgi:hypothetical protein
MFARHHPKHLKVSPKLLSHVGKVFICTSLLHNRVKAGVELSGRVACLECTGPGFDPSTQTIINTFVQEKFLKTIQLPNYIYLISSFVVCFYLGFLQNRKGLCSFINYFAHL